MLPESERETEGEVERGTEEGCLLLLCVCERAHCLCMRAHVLLFLDDDIWSMYYFAKLFIVWDK